jgi:hypothetical protein
MQLKAKTSSLTFKETKKSPGDKNEELVERIK